MTCCCCSTASTWKTSVSMTINAPAIVVMAFYLAAARERGFNLQVASRRSRMTSSKSSTLKTSSCSRRSRACGWCATSSSMRPAACRSRNPVSISGSPTSARPARRPRGAGVHAGRRLSLRRSVPGPRYGRRRLRPRLSFFFNAHNDAFEEVAKYRAARAPGRRELRTHTVRPTRRRGSSRCHAQTAGCSLQDKQPEVNPDPRPRTRPRRRCWAAAKSLHTNSMDETLALPSDTPSRSPCARQQVLAHETGVTNTVDPLGGSYFIESLTRSTRARRPDDLRAHRRSRRYDRRHRGRFFPPRDRRGQRSRINAMWTRNGN